VIIILKNAFKPLTMKDQMQTAVGGKVPPCTPLLLPGSQGFKGNTA